MLDVLKFVQGAVAKKDIVPGLQHFSIDKGVIRAYNGTIALSSPIAFDIDCKPNAGQFVKAISNCSTENGVVNISVTPKGKLKIVNGPYTALVECITDHTPHVEPDGDTIPIDGAKVRRAFESLLPFTGTDASRQWTTGVLLHAQSAYATNNVIVCEFWLGTPIPFSINVPRNAVKELLRIGEDPTHIQLTEKSVTFHFPDGKWLRTGLWEVKSDDILRVLKMCTGDPKPMHPDFFKGLESVGDMLDKIGNVYFKDGQLMTHLEDDVGSKYKLEGFDHTGCYHYDMLKLLEGCAERIDWSTYPNPCVFHGEEVRGVIVGRRMPATNEEVLERQVTVPPGYSG